jgi:uncharacterized protein
MEQELTYAAFEETRLLASGPLDQVLPVVKSRFDDDRGATILIFDNQTGRQVDFDLRGNLDEVLGRVSPKKTAKGPGRPRLGVIAREVSLLPRHWEWLEQQPSGASAALRRLVDEARKTDPGEQRVRSLIEAADRFLSAMAGNLPGYEEVTRALYARDRERVGELVNAWPSDIRSHFEQMVQDAI